MAIRKRPQAPVTAIPGLDPDGFSVGVGQRRANVRRVEPRNTPTVINAVFNHRNFWDMRAQNLFNGVICALVRTHAAALQAEATRRGLRAAWAAVHYGRRS